MKDPGKDPLQGRFVGDGKKPTLEWCLACGGLRVGRKCTNRSCSAILARPRAAEVRAAYAAVLRQFAIRELVKAYDAADDEIVRAFQASGLTDRESDLVLRQVVAALGRA